LSAARLVCALALAAAGAAPALAVDGPELDYMLHCQGCHLPDGSGSPGAVPTLRGVGRFLATSRGREYLIRVPGSAQSPLSDAELAALLDWIVARFDPETAAAGFRRFDAAEVARWRRPPLAEVEALRAALLRELEAR
jgi:mono/diheme cytochrome c family protein